MLPFNLLGRSFGNDKFCTSFCIVLSVRRRQYTLWYYGAEPNKGSTFSLGSICDVNLERKMRLIFWERLIGNNTIWEKTIFPFFLTGPSQKYISIINLIKGAVFCVENQRLEGAWIKVVNLGSPFQVCNNAHVISHLSSNFCIFWLSFSKTATFYLRCST